MIELGGNALVDHIMSEFLRAGFESVDLSPNGILCKTGYISINTGDHEYEKDNRYLGQFEVLVRPRFSIYIRNLASPRKGVNHPVLDDNDCIGGFDKTLYRCILSSNYHALALTIIAMITHFDESRRDYYDRWPKTKPEKTFAAIKRWKMFGEDGTSFEEAEEEEDTIEKENLRDKKRPIYDREEEEDDEDFGSDDDDDYDDDFGSDDDTRRKPARRTA
jgi:hypothetical protein